MDRGLVKGTQRAILVMDLESRMYFLNAQVRKTNIVVPLECLLQSRENLSAAQSSEGQHGPFTVSALRS